MNTRQVDVAAQEASAAQLLQSQIAAAAVVLGNLSEVAATKAESAEGVAVAALDLESRGRNSQSEAIVVSDSAPVVDAAPAPVLMAQAAQSESERKAAAVVAPTGGAGDKKDDDKGAAVAKDDDDKGGVWGWLGGLGLLAAAAGGGGGGGTAPSPAPVLTPETLGGPATRTGSVTEAGQSYVSNGGTPPVYVLGTAVPGTLTTTSTLTSSATGTWSLISSGTGTYGSLVLNPDGAWTYTLANNATVNALAGGQIETETFTVRTPGGETQTVTITVNGTNDYATINPLNNAVSTSVVVEQTLNSDPSTYSAEARGDLNCTDIDNTNDSWQAGTFNSQYGTLVVAANGTWTYTLTNTGGSATDNLINGQNPVDTFTVLTADGTPATVAITISGQTDYSLLLVGGRAGDYGTDLQLVQTGSVFKSAGGAQTP